jgi:hypothetical protein
MISQHTAREQGVEGIGAGPLASWGIIEGSIQPITRLPQTMEAERINAISALLNDLTSREAELRRYL